MVKYSHYYHLNSINTFFTLYINLIFVENIVSHLSLNIFGFFSASECFLSPLCPGVVVIAFVVCWLPYHARRLMFCYISDWSEWVTILFSISCKRTSSGLFAHLNSAEAHQCCTHTTHTDLHMHDHLHTRTHIGYRLPKRRRTDTSFWLDGFI